MIYIIYFLIALFATSLGAATGIGGGVIIKPVMDMLGRYDALSISAMSSVTVFVMAGVSLLRCRKSPCRPKAAIAVPLVIGAVLGGSLGGSLFGILAGGVSNALVTAVQNIVLAALVAAVLVYMLNKSRLSSLGLTGVLPSGAAGVFLGMMSAFLGIGGGPVNVAVMILCFSFSTKTAALCSLLVILFSQASKLLLTAAFSGISGLSLDALPVMVAGAVLGGLIGGEANKRIDEKKIELVFCLSQVIVFGICVLNVLRNV